MASKYQFNFDRVKESIKTEGEKKAFEKDKRFWAQEKKKENTVIIRFLPDAEGNPYAKVYSHSFSYTHGGKTKWWIENCINTFGYERECPICAKNQIYYKSAYESDKKIASQRGRKLAYISNILVVSNPNNPEENGKVFLFKYGKKVFDKIKSRMYPTEADLQDPEFVTFTPFDLFEGANFKLKTVMQGESADKMYPNYDQSAFSAPSVLVGGDEAKLDKIMGQTHLLSEFTAEDKFPTNEKVLKVLGGILGVEGFEEEENPSTTSLFDEEPDAPAADSAPTSSDDLPFNLEEDTEPEPAPVKPAAPKKSTPAKPAATPAAEPEPDSEEDEFFDQFK